MSTGHEDACVRADQILTYFTPVLDLTGHPHAPDSSIFGERAPGILEVAHKPLTCRTCVLPYGLADTPPILVGRQQLFELWVKCVG
jgi:hypothetical protein